MREQNEPTRDEVREATVSARCSRSWTTSAWGSNARTHAPWHGEVRPIVRADADDDPTAEEARVGEDRVDAHVG